MSKGRSKKAKVFFFPKLQLSDLFVVLIVEVIILHPPSSWPNCCARSMQTKKKRNNRMCLSLSICVSVLFFLAFLFLSLNVFCSCLPCLNLFLSVGMSTFYISLFLSFRLMFLHGLLNIFILIRLSFFFCLKSLNTLFYPSFILLLI